MILRIDHVAIAVKDYDRALAFLKKILGATEGAHAEDPRMKYLWQLLSVGDLSRMELLTPTGEGSFLDNFLQKKEGGVHHITIQTSNIAETAAMLKREGIPFFGYNDYGSIWKELFIHPRDAFGVLIQIAEFQSDDWLAEKVKMPQGKKFTVRKKETGATLTFAHPGGGTVSLDLSREDIGGLVRQLQDMQ